MVGLKSNFRHDLRLKWGQICGCWIVRLDPATFRLPNLKPSTTSISIRLPISLLEKIKIEANKRDVPYQSLIKIWLSERTEKVA